MGGAALKQRVDKEKYFLYVFSFLSKQCLLLYFFICATPGHSLAREYFNLLLYCKKKNIYFASYYCLLHTQSKQRE